MLASSGASPYVYNKCFLWRRRMYVCERACRYNGAVPRSSLPGRQNSGTWECLSVQGIQMETDCNISGCTFHPWREEDCKHNSQIRFPCDAWRLAYLLEETGALLCMADAGLSDRLDFKAGQINLPCSTLLPVTKFCAQNMLLIKAWFAPLVGVGRWRLSALSIPEHLSFLLLSRAVQRAVRL